MVDFCGCGGGPDEGIGTQGSAREAEGERRRNPWFWSLVLGIISKEAAAFGEFRVLRKSYSPDFYEEHLKFHNATYYVKQTGCVTR